MKTYLAIDIGASSGRCILGYVNEKEEILLKEIYRFPNNVIESNGHLIWDVEALFLEVKKGISLCLKEEKCITSMSIDTWGVDYVLLNNKEEIFPVYAYRDLRTKDIIDEVHQLISFQELFHITGTQFQEFNTIYQVYWDLKNGRLDRATDLMMIPEYFIYKLTGIKVREYTNASTTGLLDIHTGTYSKNIIKRLNLKSSLFQNLDKPGKFIGKFTREIEEELGGNIPVVLTATHDTSSAVEGITMKEEAPYISSGTWSLLGLKQKAPITNDFALAANYSNELGPEYIRFQKNIMGLWIIQRLALELDLDFPTMVQMAKKSTYKEIFDVNDSCFLSTLNMKKTILAWFKNHKKEIPLTDADYINSSYYSLAFSYHKALEELELCTNKKFNEIYIVGGGAKNTYLNDLTEQMTNKRVIALPIEATAIGNIKSQIRRKTNEKRS